MVLILDVLIVAGLVWIAIWDWRAFRIPDALVLAVGGLALIRLMVLGGPYIGDDLLIAAVAAGILWGIGWAFRKFRGYDALGFGDVKLVAVIALWEGLAIATVILVASFAAIAVTIVLVGFGRRGFGDPVPFGVYLSGAAILSYLTEWWWM